MAVSYLMLGLCWALSFSHIATGLASPNNNLQIRNAPGTSSFDTLAAIRRSLLGLKRDKTVFKNSTSLDTSWDGAVLLSYEPEEIQKGATTLSASVEIVCTTCYIKGIASAQFSIAGDLDVGQAFSNVTAEIGDEFGNITTTFVDYAENYTQSVITGLGDGIDLEDFDFPPLDIDLDIDIPDIPGCELQFQFDGLELYMEIDTILSGGATYTINLYTSRTPIGFKLGDELMVGVVFSIDLILSVEAQIDISTGFHILLNDGIAIDLHMFDKNVSSITFNGGTFEFLPVTIQSTGAVLTALLRVGVTAGLELDTSSAGGFISDLTMDFSAGVEAGVWADVAQFKTNVTAPLGDRDSDCKLEVTEEYALLLGANAGASVAVKGHTWGPTPETQIPIWYTTLASACAVTRTTVASTTPTAIAGRDDLTTTTISKKITHTAIMCMSTGLVNCPVSLQSTSKNTVTKTLVTAVPSGIKATFPATTQNSVPSPIAFGASVHQITATSGSPVSFVPPPSSTSKDPKSTSGVNGVLEGKTGGVSNKLIIGVSIGVGVPVLLAIIAGIIFCCRRKRYTPVQPTEQNYFNQQVLPSPEVYTPGSYVSVKKSPNVNVVERRGNY